MAKVKPEDRARLEELDVWPEFMGRRRRLMGEEGMDGKAALAQTLREFLGGDTGEGEGSEGDGKKRVRRVRSDKGIRRGESLTAPATSEGLLARIRGVDIGLAVRWTLWCLGMPKESVKRDDAPNPAAWAIYEWAKGEPASRNEFFLRMVVKLTPAPKEVVEGQAFTDDGAVILERIERELRGIGAAVKAAATEIAPEGE